MTQIEISAIKAKAQCKKPKGLENVPKSSQISKLKNGGHATPHHGKKPKNKDRVIDVKDVEVSVGHEVVEEQYRTTNATKI